MKITVHGPVAGVGPDGMIHSWAPDQAVEVDDGDKKAVAWARMAVSTGLATLVEDVAVKETAHVTPRQPGKPAAAK